MKTNFGIICITILLITQVASAQVAISEIMYAPATTDDKHEWVEVCTSTEVYDATDIKLFEGNVAHALTLVRGESVLQPGYCAVIADDATTFISDNPSFSGTLFDSSFSLTNGGETIALRNNSGVTIDSVSYTDSLGAKDDGATLHRSGASTFIAGSATPGTEVGFSIAGSNVTTPDNGTTQTNQPTGSGSAIIQFHTVTIEPPPQLTLRVQERMTVSEGALVHFHAEAFNAKGSVVDAHISWAFGDGYTEVGKKVVHTYPRKGVYIVHVEGNAESLTDEANIEVTVKATNVQIRVANQKDVTIANQGETILDLSAAKILAGNQMYIFPNNTQIAPGATVIFPEKLTKLNELNRSTVIKLIFPSGDEFVSENKNFTTESTQPKNDLQIPELFTVSPFGAQVAQEMMKLPAQKKLSDANNIESARNQHTVPVSTASHKKIFGMRLADLVTPDQQVKSDLSKITSETHVAAYTASASESVDDIQDTEDRRYFWLIPILIIVMLGALPFFVPQSSETEVLQEPHELSADDFQIIDQSPDKVGR